MNGDATVSESCVQCCSSNSWKVCMIGCAAGIVDPHICAVPASRCNTTNIVSQMLTALKNCDCGEARP